MKSISPNTSRSALLYRMAGGAGETGRLIWASSHHRHGQDRRLSGAEERARGRLLPTRVGPHSAATAGAEAAGDLYHFRDFPLFPGECVPPGHNALRSLRDELELDLRAQSLREAWVRQAGAGAPGGGLDPDQLADIVAALYPALGTTEAAGLVARVLELLSQPDNTARRRVAQVASAEALGLDKAPRHYTNFMEWMSRLTNTIAFKTEHCISGFTQRKFSRHDVRVMNANYRALSNEALKEAQLDGYTPLL